MLSANTNTKNSNCSLLLLLLLNVIMELVLWRWCRCKWWGKQKADQGSGTKNSSRQLVDVDSSLLNKQTCSLTDNNFIIHFKQEGCIINSSLDNTTFNIIPKENH